MTLKFVPVSTLISQVIKIKYRSSTKLNEKIFYKLNKKIKLKETQISIARPSKKKNNSSYGHLKSHQLFTNGSSGCLVSPTTLMTSDLSSEGITTDGIGSEIGEASLRSTTAS